MISCEHEIIDSPIMLGYSRKGRDCKLGSRRGLSQAVAHGRPAALGWSLVLAGHGAEAPRRTRFNLPCC
jgi:hypothetical protein